MNKQKAQRPARRGYSALGRMLLGIPGDLRGGGARKRRSRTPTLISSNLEENEAVHEALLSRQVRGAGP